MNTIRTGSIGAFFWLFAITSAMAICPSYNSTNIQTGTCNEPAGNRTFNQTGFGNYATLTVNGDLTINGNFTIVDQVVVNGVLHVTGNLNGSLGGALVVSSTGSVVVDGDVDLGFFSGATIDGSMAVGGDFDNGGNGGLDYGSTTVNGNLSVGGTFNNNGNGTLEGNGTLVGNVSDSGDSTGFNGTYTGTCTGNCDGTLPVTFISFTGKTAKEASCVLNWVTGEELNNLGFHVEKMSPVSAGFQSIGFVRGAGTTIEIQNYSFTDTDFAADAYYRLRQVDFDGTEDFSSTIFVRVMGHGDEPQLAISPNPTTGIVSLAGIDDAAVHFILLTAGGREVAQGSAGALTDAGQALSEALLKSPPGLYVLEVSSGSRHFVRRIVKR